MGIYRADLSGNVTYSNPKCQDILRLPAEAMLRRGWTQRLHPEDAPRTVAGWLVANQRSENYESQHRLLYPDGTIGWVHGHSAILFDDQRRPCGTVGTVTDITERKQLEAELRTARTIAERASCTKEQFLANVSHELRTPLNGILGMASLLIDSPLDTEQRECVEMIRDSGNALIRVVTDILDLSSVAAGKLPIQSAPFDLRSLIAQAIAAIQPKASAKRLQIISCYPEHLSSRFEGDERRIRQILLNYLMNAVNFTLAGSITVSVLIDPRLEGCASVEISVSDSGIGISKQDQATLFQPFVQVDSSSSRKQGGAGLSLALSRRLARLMGGDVGVTSQPQRGSRFWLRLPLVVTAAGI